MKWYRSSGIIRGSLLFLLGVFVATPLVRVVVGSLESPLPYRADNVFAFVKRYLSLDQYKNILFHDLEYWASFWNTILLTLPTVFLAISTAKDIYIKRFEVAPKENRLEYKLAVCDVIADCLLNLLKDI